MCCIIEEISDLWRKLYQNKNVHDNNDDDYDDDDLITIFVAQLN